MGLYGGFLKWWVSPTTIGFPNSRGVYGCPNSRGVFLDVSLNGGKTPISQPKMIIFSRKNPFLGGGNSKIVFFFTPKIGEDEPILTSIFFRGVETTN